MRFLCESLLFAMTVPKEEIFIPVNHQWLMIYGDENYVKR